MSERTVTCIGCPMGCRLRVTLDCGQVSEVDGAACGRGASYARQECVCPMRQITTLARVRGRREPLSVKTAQPVPKALIFACVEAIHRARVAPPVKIGDVVVKNVCGTGVDVVATMDVAAVSGDGGAADLHRLPGAPVAFETDGGRAVVISWPSVRRGREGFWKTPEQVLT